MQSKASQFSTLILHKFLTSLSGGVIFHASIAPKSQHTHKFFNQGVKGLVERASPASEFTVLQTAETCFIIEISANCWQRAIYDILAPVPRTGFRRLPLSFFYASEGGRSWLQFKSVLVGVANRVQCACPSIQSIRALEEIFFCREAVIERVFNAYLLRNVFCLLKCFTFFVDDFVLTLTLDTSSRN